jgi:hypothetical protein
VNGFSFYFFERYHKDGNKFLSETRVSFVNVETKEQSKQWMQRDSPNKPKKFKQMSSARKLMATVFWDRKRALMVEFMQQGTIVMSEVYCKTLKKTAYGRPFRIKAVECRHPV